MVILGFFSVGSEQAAGFVHELADSVDDCVFVGDD